MCPHVYTLVHLNLQCVCVRLPLCTQFFLIPGLRVLNRLSPDLPLPLATPLTVTPGCWSTLSSVVFLMAAGEMRSWSARNCSSLRVEGKAYSLDIQYKCRCACPISFGVKALKLLDRSISTMDSRPKWGHLTYKQGQGRIAYLNIH